MQYLLQTTQRIILINLSDINEVFGPLKRVAEGGRLVSVSYEEMKKFDLDLKFGHLGEDFVRDVQNGNYKIEVKSERDIWKNTGNMAIEIRCSSVPSGISTTEAELWVHNFYYKGKFQFSFTIPVGWLKERIKTLLEEKKARIVMGGDFDSSQMVLIPIKELF